MTLERIDLTPRIGTELKTDAETLASGKYGPELRELLEQRGVLVVRGLHMTNEQQLAFSRSLGKVQPQGEGGVFKVTIDPDVNPGAEYIKGAFFWHIDGASDDVPNLAATLNAQSLSKTGGNTHFANTYAAWDDLPEEDKRRYEGLRVVHSFEISQRYVNPEPTARELEFWQMRTPKVHPLVWTHGSGRKSLVLGSTAHYVEGMDPAEGRMLLTKLREWATQPQFVYTHRWTEGDMLIWDNTGTMHRVDQYPLEENRLMHRTTIEAEELLV
ncbi:taurine catabolism dioxygenase [Novosphingobium endophyticum]|uniref:Taurine catabolism dioxygenase n=1 Tax=Novosphingobium endophyticum TaxID=1955250 RepID=A0A916TSD0_9SPHN|nr:TauD/TfdA family dioxygenase [Novosphingobium endophyticum]GGB90280.1 taurine catabolism dioxygenase [Novosphingobium endophyticum]